MSEELLKLRKDIVNFILENHDNKNIYFNLINDKNSSSFNGFLYESIIELLIISKCMADIDYDEIIIGEYPCINRLENIKKVLNKNIRSKDGGVSDVTIKFKDVLIPFSIKYKDTIDVKNDLNDMKLTYEKEKYKTGLFVKDKNILLKHHFQNKTSTHKKNIDDLNKNNLLFDEKDVKIGLKRFCDKFKNNKFDNFCNIINEQYLLTKRKQLTLKLHQKLALLKFIKNVKSKEFKHIIAHKPRSGKSILMLLMSKYLLENNYERILIMTAVPDTINDFIQALNIYIDFNNIKYKVQKEDDFDKTEEDFRGIVFSSLQFFKTDTKNKKELLKKLNFDAIFNDECHLGGSTLKTQKNILEINSETIIDDINKNIKLNIFSSGTSEKTKKYYKIKSTCIYEWEIEDESYMKQIDNKEIKDIMFARHGNIFNECLEDICLDKDYSKCPIPVLMKYLLDENIINKIIDYNLKNKTGYGFSFSSLFSLNQINNNKKYQEQFELCSTTDGENMLINILDNIISNDPNKFTLMKKIEQIQDKYNSRKSTKKNPSLFIFFLPTNTRNNTIDGLQETLKVFLEKNNLWSSYNIEYSNSIRDTGDIKQDYNNFIKNIMKKTKDLNKKGCILFLGNKGGTGITYRDCDVTISLDDGHSIDNQKQKNSRAGTEADGKTIFINIDMNIQRAYSILLDKINKFRSITKKNISNDEIIYYLYKHEIFLFEPLHYNNNNYKVSEIQSYYKNESKNMINKIDISSLLEDFLCYDDLKEIIKTNFKILQTNKFNINFEGEQKDCPKPIKKPIDVDPPNENIENNTEKDEEEQKDINEIDEEDINQTSEMFKNFMIHMLGLYSRTANIINFKDIFDIDFFKNMILRICEEKKIDLNIFNYDKIKNIMINIIDINYDIVNSIREIYQNSTPNNIRYLIEKHFIPSKDEKKKYAEIPTPVNLVDDMLSKMPDEYWTDIHSTFEPCCGKGNFVLGIFDNFFNGLEKKIPNKVDRCKTIMNKCIYFADLTNLNIFITTEILKCHIEHKCGVKVDYMFNSNIGDTIKLDILNKFGLKNFNAVIGNAPYQNQNGNKGVGNTLWNLFVNISIEKWLLKDGYLLFVHPKGWRQIGNKTGNLMRQKQIIYLNMNDIKEGLKTFKCSTDYDYYLLQNTTVYKKSIIIDYQNKEYDYLINSDLNFIPNHSLNDVFALIKKDNKSNNFISSKTLYETRRKWMSKIKNNIYKYPCVYSINSKNIVSEKWSSRNDNGHFGISKFIFSNGEGFIRDLEGKYGLTEWAYAIICDGKNISDVEKAFKSNKLKNIIDAIKLTSNKYNYNIMKLFKKDFWKDFVVDENKTLKKKKIIIDDEEDEIDYNKYTIIQLKNIAKEKGIKLKSRLNKREIINLLN